jgi:hypothetical protein
MPQLSRNRKMGKSTSESQDGTVIQKLEDGQKTVSESETCPSRHRITKTRTNISDLSHFAEVHNDKKTKKPSWVDGTGHQAAEKRNSRCCCALAAKRLSNMWLCAGPYLVLSTAEAHLLTV